MKKYLFIIFLFFCSTEIFAQQARPVSVGILKASATEDSISNTAMNYADGYYSGDGERMRQAILPDLNKAFPRYIAKTGNIAMTYSTYSGLVESSVAKIGYLPDTSRHIRIDILFYTRDIAMVKVRSAKFNDYLQMIRLNGEWKIINVLWNSPQNSAWLNEFNPNQEKKKIEISVLGYIQGLQQCDIARLKEYVTPDFSRVNLIPVGSEGRLAIQRIRFESLEKSAWAGFGRQEESQKDNGFEILDIMDGIAMVKMKTVRNVEYLQLYRDADNWKVFNSLSTARTDNDLSDLLPAIAGETMPLFSLPVYGGGEFTLSEHQGKNILLMFPRGWVGNSWCLFCPYQYLELADMEKKEKIMKKYNLEIVFVMPYSQERIADWFSKFPDAVKTMDGIINPTGTQAPGIQGEFSTWAKKHYPMTFDLSGGVPDKTIPVLCDEKRTLSKQLKLFTEFWDNAQSEQNVSAIYLIDKEGILRWKYISQMTEDRPSTKHLMQIIKAVLH